MSRALKSDYFPRLGVGTYATDRLVDDIYLLLIQRELCQLVHIVDLILNTSRLGDPASKGSASGAAEAVVGFREVLSVVIDQLPHTQ